MDKSSDVRRFVRFACIGGACFATNLAILWAATSLLGMNYQAAVVLSFFVTNFLGYLGNRLFAFQSTSTRRVSEALRYYAAILASLGVVLLLMHVFIERLHWKLLVANAVAGLILMAGNFLLHSVWTFPARMRRAGS